MKTILRSGFLALAIMALAVPANAGPFEDGLAAVERGDYATAAGDNSRVDSGIFGRCYLAAFLGNRGY